MPNKNLCGKTRPVDKPYEIWQNNRAFAIGGEVQPAGSWQWLVLKKYQAPDKEEQNPQARWLCMVKTPIVPDGEMGDVYISDIKPWADCIFKDGQYIK